MVKWPSVNDSRSRGVIMKSGLMVYSSRVSVALPCEVKNPLPEDARRLFLIYALATLAIFEGSMMPCAASAAFG